jgi:hypothetical protein
MSSLKTVTCSLIVLTFLMGIVTPTQAIEPDAYLTETEASKIDWGSFVLTAKGSSLPSDRNNLSKAFRERNAILSGFKNLKAALNEIKIDREWSVGAFGQQHTSMNTRILDLLRTATRQETRFWPDGTCEVLLSLNLKGSNSLQKILFLEGYQSAKLPESQQQSPLPTLDPFTSIKALNENYSSIVIDARGKGATPVLFPQILNDQAEAIALPPKAKLNFHYVKIGATAGVNPLTLTLKRVDGDNRSDFVLDELSTENVNTAIKLGKIPEHVLVITP